MTASRTMPKRCAHASRGFTLIELAIVLAVVSIMAAVLVPDFIESARNRLAEKTAKDMALIQDAAKWYFVESAPVGSPGLARWPLETNPPQDCNTTAGPGPITAPIAWLANQGYLAAGLLNPWQGNYQVCLVPSDEAAQPPAGNAAVCAVEALGLHAADCLFRDVEIRTNQVPQAVFGVIQNALPQAFCGALTGLPGPGNANICISRIPRPGSEASITRALTGNNLPHDCRTQGPVVGLLASCNAGEVAVGGGGTCAATENLEQSHPSDDPPTTWQIVCSGAGAASTYVICCDTQFP